MIGEMSTNPNSDRAATTITGTTIKTSPTQQKQPHIKEGYVKYKGGEELQLADLRTSSPDDSHPKIIEDCPSCGDLNTVRVVLAENTDPRGKVRPQYVAVGEYCINDCCDHTRP